MSENNETHFIIHYNSDGEPIDVTSDIKGVTITKVEPDCGKKQELPPDVKTDELANTTILFGHHNPRCKYIWVPRRGWVWVCWS